MIIRSGPILCGVDFSDQSRRALRYAQAFAARLGQPLMVVSAVDPLLAEAANVRMGPAPFTDRVLRDLDAFVKETLGSPAAGAPPVSLRAPIGVAAKELLATAKEADASVTVVGTQGLGRARRLVLGSTTMRVMRGTDRPVLAVPPPHDGAAAPAPGAITRVFCGVDFSGPSRSAAEAAVALGRRWNVPVTLVHAVMRLTLPSIWEMMASPTDDEREAEERALLQELAAKLGPPVPGVHVGVGEPDEIIGEQAAATEGELIVLGLGDLSGHRPGSTAMRIMAETHAPVLAIPR